MKSRKRKKRTNIEQQNKEYSQSNWNGVIKNFSGEAVTDVEEKLFMKGKKFCPVELDPPIVRIQKELNAFFRTLRLQWIFQDQPDKRTELEKKKKNQKSGWEPPKVCSELEKMISRIQEKFDMWSPPRHTKDVSCLGGRLGGFPFQALENNPLILLIVPVVTIWH
jgi:hypothetical protein